MNIKFIEPSVTELKRDTDWIPFLGRVAATSRRADGDDPMKAKKRVDHCFRRGHLSVFEHWPIVLRYPPTHFECRPSWHRLGGSYYGNLRMCIPDGPRDDSDFARLGSFVAQSRVGAAIEEHHTFRFVCSRYAADQLRTYRFAVAHIVESQRYCNYAKLGFEFVCRESTETRQNAQHAVDAYTRLLEQGKAEDARAWLPMCHRTTHVMTAPRWKWGEIIKQRAHHSTGRAQRETSELIKRVEAMLAGRE